MVITCSYCHQEGHNITGCGLHKAGILPENMEAEQAAVRRRSRAIPEDISNHETWDLTQEHDSNLPLPETGDLTQEEPTQEDSNNTSQAHVLIS